MCNVITQSTTVLITRDQRVMFTSIRTLSFVNFLIPIDGPCLHPCELSFVNFLIPIDGPCLHPCELSLVNFLIPID